MVKEIIKVFDENNIELSESGAEALYEYYKFLIDENSRVNLTSITDFNEVIIKHFLDSVSILKYIPQIRQSKIIDVGTGAGFPGMVLAVLCPDTNVTLLETLGKRVDFLNKIKTNLSLDNVITIKARAEDAGKDMEFRETFDYVLSRAVAPLNILSEYLLPFVKTGGSMIAYKSGDPKEEIADAEKAISTLGGSLPDMYRFSLPNGMGERSFFVSKKISPTPPGYPRRAGIPSKRPII